MPDTTTLLDSLPEDPGAPETAPKDRKARVPQASKEDKRAAVDTVLALLGKPTTTGGTNGKRAASVLPSARARSAIERLVAYGTVENLEQHTPDLKELARDLFDWNLAGGPTKATKLMARTLGSVLTARDEHGVSLYPQAVEMLAFASAAAPLVQPDRLIRIIEAAPTVRTAFAPERYTMQLASALNTVLKRYAEARREQLLITLWQSAHTGRWWDMTSGIVELKTGPGARRRRRRNDEPDPEEERREAHQAIVRELLAGAAVGTTAANTAITGALLDGALPYHPATVDLVRALPYHEQLHTMMAQMALNLSKGDAVDPDVALHASHLAWLLPADRPESPILWPLRTLISSITPDPETGIVAIDAMPDKPKQFAELFPKADLVTFPFPNAVFRLDRTPLPGIDGAPVLMEIVHNATELADNRDYMGNCTFSYLNEMKCGKYVLFKLWRGPDCYNACARADVAGWHVGEINSRFNAGGVPDDIRAAFTALTATLPRSAEVELAGEDAHARQRRNVRYMVV